MNKIQFDETDHTYTVTTENGKTYTPQSVTTIIGKIMHTYEGVPADTLNAAAKRGTEIHDMLEQYIKTGQRPQVAEMTFKGLTLAGFDDIAEDLQLQPIMVEEPVTYIDEDGTPLFCGKFDNLSATRYGITIIDYKTTAEIHTEELALQLTAYAMALEQRYPGLRIKKGLCIHLPRFGYPKVYEIPLLDHDEVLEDFRQIINAETTEDTQEITMEDLPW